MSNKSLSRTVTVRNAQGLHARPANLLVRAASEFEATIMIGKGSALVDCKSILSLLTLGAAEGTELLVTAEGADAQEAIQSIEELFELGFDEPVESGSDAETAGEK